MTCSDERHLEGQCPLCGRPNDCRLAPGAEGKGPCWCEKIEIPDALLAQVPAESVNQRCICRNCVMTFLSQRYKTAGVPANLPGDFYFDSDGLMVFTAAYLRRRGSCCDSGCRHCPYREAAKS